MKEEGEQTKNLFVVVLDRNIENWFARFKYDYNYSYHTIALCCGWRTANVCRHTHKHTKCKREIWYWQEHNFCGSELDFTFVDGFDDLLGVLLVDGDANRLSSSEDALDGTGEGLRERFVVSFHDLSDFLDLLEGEITSVLDYKMNQREK